MRKSYLKAASLILFASTVVLLIFSIINSGEVKQAKAMTESVIKDYEKKSASLDSKINEIDTGLLKLQEKYYSDKLSLLMDRDQLISIAKKQWKYTLTVNGEQFAEDYIYPSESDIVIILAELQANKGLLPSDIQMLGSVTGGDEMDKFYDHMLIDSKIAYDRSFKEHESGTEAVYTFKGVPSGTIITLKLSEALREQLGTDSGILEVILK